MDKRIIAHFQKADPVLYGVLKRLLTDGASGLTPTVVDDYFVDLCETIICQQLSDKAGSTIFARFKGLFPKGNITAKKVLALTDEQIRAVGTSGSKVRFIKNLAEKIVNSEVNLQTLKDLPDNDVVNVLVQLKGIGPWTAEMFLMFALGREDIFSHGDLGLRRAIQKIYGFTKEPTPKQIERIVKPWSPYRTYACRILWRSLDVLP